jgi:hypothetical protein
MNETKSLSPEIYVLWSYTTNKPISCTSGNDKDDGEKQSRGRKKKCDHFFPFK